LDVKSQRRWFIAHWGIPYTTYTWNWGIFDGVTSVPTEMHPQVPSWKMRTVGLGEIPGRTWNATAHEQRDF